MERGAVDGRRRPGGADDRPPTTRSTDLSGQYGYGASASRATAASMRSSVAVSAIRTCRAPAGP